MAKPVRPGLTGACGCSTPWVAGLGGCCAKRLELVADFNAELELARKAESDATYGDATYGITHTPPPVSIRREFIVLGDKSPPLEAPDSPGSSRGSRRLFEDERGSDGVLRQDMDVYQLELQRLLEIQLVLERGADEGARPGFTSLYGTMPKEPAPQQDFDSDLGLAMTTAPAATPLPAQARRTYVPDSPGVDVVRRQAAPEARQLRDAYIAAANGNAAPLEVLRAAAEWSGEAEYAPSFAPSAEKPRGSPVPRRAASDTALVTRGPDSLDPVGGRTAVRRGIRHCRHVPMGRRRAVLRKYTSKAVSFGLHLDIACVYRHARPDRGGAGSQAGGRQARGTSRLSSGAASPGLAGAGAIAAAALGCCATATKVQATDDGRASIVTSLLSDDASQEVSTHVSKAGPKR